MKTDNLSISNNEKLTLIGNFSTMLSSGISILEAVDSLMEDAKGNQKKLLQALSDDLVQGKHVYASFSRFPNIFDKVIINIIKASEEAGTLDITLKDLKDNIQKDIEFNDKVKGAMIYPSLIFIVFIGVLLLMLTFVVPKMTGVFVRLNIDLPLPTKILMFMSDLLLKNTIPLILIAGAIIGGILFIYKKNKKLIFNVLFSLPIISDLVRLIDLTRFSRSMYLLLNAGLTITNALDLTRDVVLKREVKKVIQKSYDMVVSGKRLSEGLRTGRGIVPSIMIKMVEVGEKSGSLEKSMQDVSNFLDYEVSKKLKTLLALMEPIMLILVGGLVGGIMLAILAPIYGLIGQIKR